ncbi:ComEC/Rec2 family competence protein [Patescibacteria group bacterium]
MEKMERIRKNFRYLFVGFLFICAVFVWYVVVSESRSGLAVNFLDVGQGDATFVQAENGRQVLIDGGENKSILRQLARVIPFYDRSIDILILSHAHGDHVGGLVEVLRRYKISLVVEPCLEVDTPEYKEFVKIIEEKNVIKVCAQRGQKINLSDGLYFDVLLPAGEVEGRKVHDSMLVAKLIYGEVSFLFAGDMAKNLESYLVQVDDLESNVLKIGHHGSDTSSSEMFLGYVNPEYAIISSGEGNKFGHPHKETLENLEKFEIDVLRTDKLGTIKIKTDSESISVQ